MIINQDILSSSLTRPKCPCQDPSQRPRGTAHDSHPQTKITKTILNFLDGLIEFYTAGLIPFVRTSGDITRGKVQVFAESTINCADCSNSRILSCNNLQYEMKRTRTVEDTGD